MWYFLFGLIVHTRSGVRSIRLSGGVLLLSFLPFLISGCHRSASPVSSTDWMDARVTVLNKAASSGCQYILHPEEGPDLLPVSFAGESVNWVQEGIYLIRYRPEPVPVFACTAEAVPVQVVGVEPVQTAPPAGTGGIRAELPACVQVIDPYQVAWMTQVMEQANPRRVVRYQLDGLTVYGFWGNDRDERLPFYLFDCRGKRLCVQTDAASSCTLQERLQDEYTILIRNH